MSNINEQYLKSNQIFEKLHGEINIDIQNSKYPISNKCLMRSSKKIDFILKGIIDAKESFYLSQILTRVLFEHFLIGHYIWTKLRIDENDNVGNEFMNEYFVSEAFKRENYDFNIEDIKSNKKEKNDIERVKLKYPELKELEQSGLNNIHQIANQFDIRKIGNYLINHIPTEDAFKDIHLLMLDFLNNYNYLSSYIHGGVYSEMETFDNLGEINKEQACRDNIDWGEIASKLTKRYVISSLAIEYPSKYMEVWKQIIEF